MALTKKDLLEIEQLLTKYIEMLRIDIRTLKTNQKSILDHLIDLQEKELPKRVEQNEQEIVAIKEHLNIV